MYDRNSINLMELTPPKVILRANPDQVSGSHLVFLNQYGQVCKQCSQKELDFYEQLPSSLAQVVPQYYGGFKLRPEIDEISLNEQSQQFRTILEERSVQLEGSPFIALQNIADKMTKPCMLDLKLQVRSYNPSKTEKQTKKIINSSCATHGFRMCGYNTLE